MSSLGSDLDEWERRTLLRTLGPAGLGLIAGCLGDDDGDGGDGEPAGPNVTVPDVGEDDDDGSGGGPVDGDGGGDDIPDPSDVVDPRRYNIDGQTLRIPMETVEPSNAHFLNWAGEFDVPHEKASSVMTGMSGYPATGSWHESAISTFKYTDIYSELYESVEFSPEKIRLEIKEDANWSDGEPITARDCKLNLYLHYALGPEPPGQLFFGAPRPPEFFNFPDGEDGKVIEHLASEPWVEEVDGWMSFSPDFNLSFTIGPWPRNGGLRPFAPHHKHPYDCYHDVAQDVWDLKAELMREEPRVWNDPDYMRDFKANDPDNRSPFLRLWQEEAPDEWIEPWGGAAGQSIITTSCVPGGENEENLELVENSRDPEWQTSFGLYELDQISGSEGFRLRPNEEWRQHDEHTFDEVFIEWVQEDHREKAGLMAERYDYSGVTLAPEEKATLPEQYAKKTYPSSDGMVLSLNHLYWVGDSPLIRQGLKFATNEGDVASNVDPDTRVPILTPGWDHWSADEFISEEWANENLITYEQDLERAEELFEQAGYEMIDGNWHDAEGEPIDEVIATTESAPIAEETIADQWRRFGIQIETLVMDEATLQERWEGSDDPFEPGMGEIAITPNMWPSARYGGYFASLIKDMPAAVSFIRRVRARNWFGEEATEFAGNEYPPGNYSRSLGDWQEFTMDIPPAGQPESNERVTFNPPWVSQNLTRLGASFAGEGQPVQEGQYEPDAMNVENTYQAFAWAFNYYLWDLPILQISSLDNINSQNWLWGPDIPDVDGLNTNVDSIHANWDNWGLDDGPHYYPGMNYVWGDPENTKLNSEFRYIGE